jgi:hypothetical protein
MRIRTTRLTALFLAGVAFAPAAAWGQEVTSVPINYSPPDPQVPLPLFHDRIERGGFFVAGDVLYFRQSVPVRNQVIATRGLVDFDGSITADLTGQVIEPVTSGTLGAPFILRGPIVPGNFLGSNAIALNAQDVLPNGNPTFVPGFSVTAGWKFENQYVLDLTWWHLQEAKYAAGATLVPPGLNPGAILTESFLFSPVYNFPNEFAGPALKLALGNPFAAFGIWNGASTMTISFVQRFEQLDMSLRVPTYQDDCMRCYGLIGPRFVWMWENFKWRTVSVDFGGNAGQDDVAIFSNVVSNRMYGVHIGGGFDRRLGDTWLGTLSLSVDVQGAALLDVVKERAKFERGDFYTSSKRARSEYTMVPEVQGRICLWWYPVEGIQIKIGYDAMAFFNTVAAPNPVSFNYSTVEPTWEKGQYRLLHGFEAGIGFIF